MSTVSNTNKSALLVVPNMIYRRLTTRLMEKKGLQVTPCESYIDGVAACKTHLYDVVFIDVFSLGDELQVALRQFRGMSDYYNDVPIVALSTNKSSNEVESSFAETLSMPINEQELDGIIDKYLSPSSDEEETLFDQLSFENSYSDAKLRLDVLHIMLEDEQASVAYLEKAFATEDSDHIYSKIHYIKASFNYLKATRMVSMVQELLDLLKAGELSEVLSRKDKFLTNYRMFRDTISTYLNSLSD